jgi:hypothetical protein
MAQPKELATAKLMSKLEEAAISLIERALFNYAFLRTRKLSYSLTMSK